MTSDRVMPEARKAQRRFGRAVAALALLVAAIYANSLGNGFVFDDRSLVIENPALTRPDGFFRIIDIFNPSHESYRPVRNLSYLADRVFYDFNPVGYRITNILVHIAACAAVYSIGLFIGLNARACAAGALIFASHPLNTESVAYISGRRDLLCTFFYLASLLCFLDYRRRARWPAAFGCVVCFVVSVFAKEMGATLPAAALGLELLMRRRRPAAKRTPALHAVLWTAAAAYLYYKLYYRHPSLHPGFHGGSISLNFMTSARIAAHYALLVFFPILLNADYSGFPVSTDILDPAGAAAVVFVLTALAASVLAAAKGRGWPLPILWCALTLLPVMQVVPHHDLMAEHFLYLPLAGAALGAGAVLERVAARKSAAWRNVLLCAAVAIFSLRTVRRNRDWKDSLTFWRTTAERTLFPCARANAGLGIEYRRLGELARAEACLRESLRLEPGMPRAAAVLAALLRDTGRTNEAEQVLLRAISDQPELSATRLKLAQFYADLGMIERSASVILDIARDFPDSPDAMYAMGRLCALYRRWDEAAAWYEKALKVAQESDYYAGLAEAESHRGRIDAALDAARIALKIDPGNGRKHLLVANLLLVRAPPDVENAARHIRTARDAGTQAPEGLLKLLSDQEEKLRKGRQGGNSSP